MNLLRVYIKILGVDTPMNSSCSLIFPFHIQFVHEGYNMRSFPIYGTGAFTIFSRLLGWSVFMVHFCRRYAVFPNKVLKAMGFLSSMQGASTKSEGDFRSTKPAKKKSNAISLLDGFAPEEA